MSNLFAGIGIGAGIGAALMYASFKWSGNNIPFDITDAKSVIAKLRPVSKGDKTDVSLFMWGDGSVNISVKVDYGSELTGRGDSLPDAVADIKKKSQSIAEALK